MHSLPSRPSRPPSRLLAACLASFAIAPAFGAEPAAVAPEVPVLPGEVSRRVIDHGDHRTVLIEMVAEAARPTPDAAPPLHAAVTRTSPLTAAVAEQDTKPCEDLPWSITVYSGAAPLTVIEGTAAGGGAWRVVSSIDFSLLRNLPSFETKRAIYLWLPGLGLIEGGSASEPQISVLRASVPTDSYRVILGEPGPAGRDALDYLHAYHAAHHTELVLAETRQRAEEERRERELRENPPRPPDTIVRYTTPVDRPVNPAASIK